MNAVLRTCSVAEFIGAATHKEADATRVVDFFANDSVATIFAEELVTLIARYAQKKNSPFLSPADVLCERDFHRTSPRNEDMHTYIMQAYDRWISLTLSRPEDRECLPALTHGYLDVDATDFEMKQYVREQRATAFRDHAVLLGLSCAVLDEITVVDPHAIDVYSLSMDECVIGGSTSKVVNVLDLSSLWAGPLCARTLMQAGADVTVLESTTRPDSHRTTLPTFFAALRGGANTEQHDVADPAFRDVLRSRIASADVVITSSRPRALAQWGVDPHEFMTASPASPRPHCWISITGFGRAQPERIGFGDDAAFAASLVGGSADAPELLGDAVADPLTGLAAATVVLHSLASGQRVHAHIGLADIAATAVALSRQRARM